jgi:hypothetical protein
MFILDDDDLWDFVFLFSQNKPLVVLSSARSVLWSSKFGSEFHLLTSLTLPKCCLPLRVFPTKILCTFLLIHAYISYKSPPLLFNVDVNNTVMTLLNMFWVLLQPCGAEAKSTLYTFTITAFLTSNFFFSYRSKYSPLHVVFDILGEQNCIPKSSEKFCFDFAIKNVNFVSDFKGFVSLEWMKGF